MRVMWHTRPPYLGDWTIRRFREVDRETVETVRPLELTAEVGDGILASVHVAVTVDGQEPMLHVWHNGLELRRYDIERKAAEQYAAGWVSRTVNPWEE